MLPSTSSVSETVPLWLHNFQMSLMERFSNIEKGVGILETGQREIVRRLETQNGAIARHEARFVDFQTEYARVHAFIADHNPKTCGVGEQVSQLSAQIEANRSTREQELAAVRADLIAERKAEAAKLAERSRWNRVLHPGYILAVLLFILLIIGHGDLLTRALKGLGI